MLEIKAKLGDDIRRFGIHNEDLTYDELVLMMQRVFKKTLNTNDELLIKYLDEDEDLITILDDSDIHYAIQLDKVLKLTIFVVGKDEKNEEAISLQAMIKDLNNKLNAYLELNQSNLKNVKMEKSETSSAVNEMPNSTLSMNDFKTAFDPLNSENQSVNEEINNEGVKVEETNSKELATDSSIPTELKSSSDAITSVFSGSSSSFFENTSFPTVSVLDGSNQIQQPDTNLMNKGNIADKPVNSGLDEQKPVETPNQQTTRYPSQLQQQQAPQQPSQAQQSPYTNQQYPSITNRNIVPPQNQSQPNSYGPQSQASTFGQVPTSYGQQGPSVPYSQQQQVPAAPYGQQQQGPPVSYTQQGAYGQQPITTVYGQQGPRPPLPFGQQQPPANFNQQPMPAGPRMQQPTNPNPHRLFGHRAGGSAYRMRQPGPGYQ